MKANFDLYPNFSKAEFDCKHTGKNEMKHSFMSKLQALRTAYGKPMIISSGYRDLTHPAEVNKPKPNGAHPTGKAADILIDRKEAYEVLKIALVLGFTGIGINHLTIERVIIAVAIVLLSSYAFTLKIDSLRYQKDLKALERAKLEALDNKEAQSINLISDYQDSLKLRSAQIDSIDNALLLKDIELNNITHDVKLLAGDSLAIVDALTRVFAN